MVICLSNTGYQSEGYHKTGYTFLAEEIDHFARITGGAIHNFLNSPVINKNKKNENSGVTRIARKGIVAVRVDFEFTKFSPQKSEKTHTISVSQKTE